jgi:AcrR family transcriptional regulator
MSGEERRAQIVRTAIDLFSAHGFKGTTTRELSLAVGVSEPVLYQHFQNKKELYTGIVEHIILEDTNQFQPRLESLLNEQDERAFLQGLGEFILGWYLDDPRIIRLLLFSALEGHELAEIWHEQVMSAFFQPINIKIASLVESGRFRQLDPTVVTRAFMGMVGQYALLSVVFKMPLFPMTREQTVARFVDIFIDGARRP